MEQRYDEHYIRSITQMGDTQNVVTSQAIFTTRKIKLIEKGVRVNSALFERLVSHKLIPKIDHCLAVENGISRERIKAYAMNLLDTDPGLDVLRGDAKVRSRIARAFDEIPLCEPMAFKLTVAWSQRPEVFDHSIRVALIALSLAIRNFFLSVKELATLAAAAVFHDIGILHVAPELLRPGRRLERSERHHLYAHPITGYLILREFAEYHPEISRTVFEHHERLDGSGYPRGLKEEQICLGAQILMLAEAANTIFEQGHKAKNLARFSVLLKLNQKKFNGELSNCLLALVQEMQSDDEDHVEAQSSAFASAPTLESRLREVAGIFENWKVTRAQCHSALETRQEALTLPSIIDERIQDLQRMLLHAGFDVSNPGILIAILQDDPEAMIELNILLGEVRWQLREIIYEAHRRLDERGGAVDGVESSALDWITRNEKAIELR